MNPREVAAVLAEIAMLTEVVGDNPFRARAFATAARSLEISGADVEALARAGTLASLPGVGGGIASTIEELVQSGESSLHQRLRESTPVGLYDVMRVPGLGAKRIRTLYRELGVDSLDTLEAAAREGEVARLPGFGVKTEAKVLAGVAFARGSRGRRRFPAALEGAVHLLEAVRSMPEVEAAEIAGDLRRRLEVVDAMVVVAAASAPAAVLATFQGAHGGDQEALEVSADRVSVRLSDGVPLTLVCVRPADFVPAMVRETGNGEHMVALERQASAQGLKFTGHSLKRGRSRVQVADEEAFYVELGLQYVPPELREGNGEIEAAGDGLLPVLIEPEALRGTFHCHTTYSDGRGTVAEMAEAARALGWSYLGLADHSRSAGYAGGLSVAQVQKQHREIDAWNAANGGEGADRFRIFKGIESEILADGSLDYDDDLLARFDYVVGSIHSGFAIGERAMTARIVRAVENPRLTFLGHPTGRILLVRDAYPVDVREVIDAAAANGVAIEINADPARLDLDWRHVRYAAEKGVLIPINPDAHSTRALENVAFGVNQARKGWLTARQVLNTWTLEEVEGYFAQRKQEGAARANRGDR